MPMKNSTQTQGNNSERPIKKCRREWEKKGEENDACYSVEKCGGKKNREEGDKVYLTA